MASVRTRVWKTENQHGTFSVPNCIPSVKNNERKMGTCQKYTKKELALWGSYCPNQDITEKVREIHSLGLLFHSFSFKIPTTFPVL